MAMIFLCGGTEAIKKGAAMKLFIIIDSDGLYIDIETTAFTLDEVSKIVRTAIDTYQDRPRVEVESFKTPNDAWVMELRQ